MFKKLLFPAILMTLLFSFCTALADQNGSQCYCNIDEYGCRITAEDGGKIYIMFWTEDARRYIMGPQSAPYENVTIYPGFSGIFPIDCGRPVIVTETPAPAPDSCRQEYESCLNLCDRSDCIDGQQNCIDKDTCYLNCKRDYDLCVGSVS